MLHSRQGQTDASVIPSGHLCRGTAELSSDSNHQSLFCMKKQNAAKHSVPSDLGLELPEIGGEDPGHSRTSRVCTNIIHGTCMTHPR